MSHHQHRKTTTSKIIDWLESGHIDYDCRFVEKEKKKKPKSVVSKAAETVSISLNNQVSVRGGVCERSPSFSGFFFFFFFFLFFVFFSVSVRLEMRQTKISDTGMWILDRKINR